MKPLNHTSLLNKTQQRRGLIKRLKNYKYTFLPREFKRVGTKSVDTGLFDPTVHFYYVRELIL